MKAAPGVDASVLPPVDREATEVTLKWNGSAREVPGCGWGAQTRLRKDRLAEEDTGYCFRG